MRYGPRAEWWERPVRDARDAPDFNAEMILVTYDRLKEARESARGKWLREVMPYFYPCPRKEWYTFNSKTKENSNMNNSGNTATPAVEYSKNCAVRTLQQQLERAEKLRSERAAALEYWTSRYNNVKKDKDAAHGLLHETDENIKQLKAALKKLGAAPAAKISK